MNYSNYERRMRRMPMGLHFDESQLGIGPIDCEHFKTESQYAHGEGYGAVEGSSERERKRLDGRPGHRTYRTANSLL